MSYRICYHGRLFRSPQGFRFPLFSIFAYQDVYDFLFLTTRTTPAYATPSHTRNPVPLFHPTAWSRIHFSLSFFNLCVIYPIASYIHTTIHPHIPYPRIALSSHFHTSYTPDHRVFFSFWAFHTIRTDSYDRPALLFGFPSSCHTMRIVEIVLVSLSYSTPVIRVHTVQSRPVHKPNS